MDNQQYIVRDPKICGGEPVIKGTRVTVRTILASLAEGASIQEIFEDFPRLAERDVRAVIAFAATSAEEDLPVPSIPNIHPVDGCGEHGGALLGRRDGTCETTLPA